MKHLLIIISLLTAPFVQAQNFISLDLVGVEMEQLSFTMLDSVNLQITNGNKKVTGPHFLAFRDTSTLFGKRIYKEVFDEVYHPYLKPRLSFPEYNGVYEQHYPNGQIKYRAEFKYSYLSGNVECYDSLGNLLFWEKYHSRHRYSFMEYHPQSAFPKRFKNRYKELRWSREGILRYETNEDIEIIKEWYPNGAPQYAYDHHQMIYKRWHENGQLSYFHTQGISKFWDDEGQLTEYHDSIGTKQ